MSEVTIRAARAEDLPAVGELTFQAYQADGQVGSGYAGQLKDARVRFEQSELLVAVDDEDNVLGTVAIASPGTPMREIARDDQLEFRMLAVAPAARGRGVGEALTRKVLDRAVELGLTGVALSSSDWMHAAHRLYERLGFRRTPDLDWSPEPGVQLVAYRLDL
jgi:ribosomal protein S18 acetylase RimI-like enzyme